MNLRNNVLKLNKVKVIAFLATFITISVFNVVRAGGVDCKKALFGTFYKRYVISGRDFLRHTKLHIKRVRELGLYLVNNYPERFDHLSVELAEKFLSLHDQSKVNFKYSPQAPIYQRLYRFYGINDQYLDEFEHRERGLLINELNGIDHMVSNNFFRDFNLVSKGETARQLLELEKIADYVDRGMSPVSREEFAKKMVPGSDYFTGSDHQMASELEKNYSDLVKGLEYQSIQPPFK